GVAPPDEVEALAPQVAHVGELDVGQLEQVADEVRTPVAEADDAEPDRDPPRGRQRRLVAVERGHVVAVLPRRTSSGVRHSSQRSSPSDQPRTYPASMSSASP